MIGITKEEQLKRIAKPKQKTCKICKEKFVADPNLFCPPTCEKSECRYEYAMKHLNKKQKDVKKQNNVTKRAFKASDRSIIKAKAQRLVNRYARLRDQYENGIRCVTCDSTKGKRDGGHFLPTSGYSAIRYNTNQIFQQCVSCNQHNHGRPKEYRVFMVSKYGEEYVKNLEAQNVTRSYSTEYLLKLIKVVSKKIKKMELKLKSV